MVIKNLKGRQVQMTTYLPPNLKKKLLKISAKTQIPMNRILNNAIERELARMEKK